MEKYRTFTFVCFVTRKLLSSTVEPLHGYWIKSKRCDHVLCVCWSLCVIWTCLSGQCSCISDVTDLSVVTPSAGLKLEARIVCVCIRWTETRPSAFWVIIHTITRKRPFQKPHDKFCLTRVHGVRNSLTVVSESYEKGFLHFPLQTRWRLITQNTCSPWNN